jgi:hypothetical protein
VKVKSTFHQKRKKMMMSSSKNVTLVLIITWVMFMSGSFKSGVEGLFQKARVFVTIRNDLTVSLSLGCHSSDNNLGSHTLQPSGTFEFTFKPNFRGSTKYVCYFKWIYNNGVYVFHDNFLLYKYQRDKGGCGTHCLWGINATGATQFAPLKKDFNDHIYLWP